jgi:hypothetical protein
MSFTTSVLPNLNISSNVATGKYSNVSSTGDSVVQLSTGNLIITANTGYISFTTGATDSSKFTILNNGNIGIGTPTPVASAAVEIVSTTQGFKAPVMTNTQKAAISAPATGLQVYDSTTNHLSIYNGLQWTNTGPVLLQTLITVTATSTNTASINFTGIPATFNHLRIIFVGQTVAQSNINMYFNNITTNTYDYENLYGTNGGFGSPATIATSAMQVAIGQGNGNASPTTANIYMPAYSNTSFNKSYIAYQGICPQSAGTSFVNIYGGSNRSTTIINQVTIIPAISTTFANGTLAYLYGEM